MADPTDTVVTAGLPRFLGGAHTSVQHKVAPDQAGAS